MFSIILKNIYIYSTASGFSWAAWDLLSQHSKLWLLGVVALGHVGS